MKMNKLSLSFTALACAVLMFAGCKQTPAANTEAEITAAKIVITPAVAATETTPAVDEVAVKGVINSSSATISFTMEQGASLGAIVPVFTLSDGATMDYVAGTAVDLNNPLTVKVTAEDGVTVKDWTVTADNNGFNKSDKKAIEKFSYNNIDAVINEAEKTISLVLPSGTNLSNIAPTIVVSDYAKVSPASGESVSFKFNSKKVYTVTAEDGSKAEYTVEVTAPRTGCNIEDFSIGVGDVTISTGGEANTVSIILPAGTQNGTFTPTIEVSDGATVSPASGVAQNFSAPVTYTVTAESGATKTYSVIVTVNKTCSAYIEKVEFTVGQKTLKAPDTSNPAPTVDYGVIDYAEKTITFYYSDIDADLKSLAPTITLSHADATVSPVSGEVQDFSEEKVVNYKVTDGKGSTAEYSMKFIYRQ